MEKAWIQGSASKGGGFLMSLLTRLMNRLRFRRINAVYAVPADKLIEGRTYYDVIPGGALTPTKLIFRFRDRHRLYFNVDGKDYTRQSWVMRSEGMLVFPSLQNSPFWSTEKHDGHVGRFVKKR